MNLQYPSNSLFPWLDSSEALDTLQRVGLPRNRSEPWKYTNPETIVAAIDSSREDPFETAISCEDPKAEFTRFQTPDIHKVASKLIGSVAHTKDLPLIALNLLNLNGGCIVRVPPNHTMTSELNLCASPNVCERIVVVVESGATLHINEISAGGNRVIECLVSEGASLTYTRLQEPTSSVEFGHLAVRLGNQSQFHFSQTSTGAELRRNEINVDVLGSHSEVEMNGIWKLEDNSHCDTQVCISHWVPRSKSEMKFHGVVGGTSRGVFNGRIYIARDAQHTSAHLTNKNILMSESAEIFTKPELEIYADDVQCSHGATSGQLDEDHIFYCQSRGLPEDVARSLLVNGFLREVVADQPALELLGIGN